ncbi:MAG: M48 family metallopeptidase [Alphaproteobacteria bacterium]|jgi:STE24 endopeptidase|nr:M48 family metallopeptidase [Alphaproteobacteria bacterium]MBU2042210.1 M48 family metallopeptidase [Alphaproteobacteria bacterium]MBU2125606.1 M48 family metallopeptidase [Alphaproteobacteria bacterium]MBU2208401.1 M48 family metallopeptidase [Alphaproteobacteria bacterium]MBU2290364.1 M48 family metallopeptidase [Alphaproteobacteria bacterium]
MSIDPAAETARWLATISPEDLERAVAYTRGGHWLLLWGAIVSLVVAWIIIRTGVLNGIRDRLERRRKRPKLVSLAVGVVYLLMSWFLTLPWSIYQSWWRETQYGLTEQSLAGWLGEAALGAAISTVFMGLLIVALYFIIRHARRLWWAWGAGLTAVAIVFLLLVLPIFIEPLFNTYTPAPDGPMRDSVVELAHRTGTPDDKIYIYDGSKQSDRYTANVSGLFGSARVAMSDVMFAKGADLAEVRGVVGHEMGHYVHMHSLWLAGMMVLLAGIGFWLVDRLFPVAKRLLGASRVGDISDPAGLPVLAAIGAVIGLLSTPVQSTMIRWVETDADRFSLIHANEPDGLSKALIKTAEYRAPSPSAIEELFFYDHPSVENRIRMAMEWKATHPANEPAASPAAAATPTP